MEGLTWEKDLNAKGMELARFSSKPNIMSLFSLNCITALVQLNVSAVRGFEEIVLAEVSLPLNLITLKAEP
jgi:hypothetical protein